MRHVKIDQTIEDIGAPGANLGAYLSRTVELSMAAGLTTWEIVAVVDRLEKLWDVRLHPRLSD